MRVSARSALSERMLHETPKKRERKALYGKVLSPEKRIVDEAVAAVLRSLVRLSGDADVVREAERRLAVMDRRGPNGGRVVDIGSTRPQRVEVSA